MKIAESGAFERKLKRFVFVSCVLVVCGFSYLSDKAYHYEYLSPAIGPVWNDFLKGGIRAPDQYRIGVFFPAHFLSELTHGHVAVYRMLALFDGAFLSMTLWIGFSLLAGHPVYRKLSNAGRLAANLIALGLTIYCLSWFFEYHKFETVANAACIAIVGGLLAGRIKWPAPLSALGLVLISAYFATIRADSAMAVSFGVGLIGLLPGRRALPLGRVTQIVTAIAGAAVILAVEFYISRVMFPNAPYSVSPFQLLNNLAAPGNYFCDVVAFGPWFFTLFLARRYWHTLEAWECALLIASVVEFLVFIVVAMSNEVRLFLPYSMALVPVSAVLVMRYFLDEATGADAAP